MDNGRSELIMVVVVLVFLLVLGITATALFIRQWKREHPPKK
jgi:Tfp pilus assembly protein PilN